MFHLIYYVIMNDLNVYNNTSRSNFEYLQSFIGIDQNPEESGFNDFDTTFEDLLNSCEYEDLFTETEEKLEEESLEVLKDTSGFLGEKYDIKEISYFLLWGSITNRLLNDEYKAFLTYYNPFLKIKSHEFISKKNNLQNFYWFLDQSFFLEENFLTLTPIYFLNNNYLSFVNWSYSNVYFNNKERVESFLSPLDYFENYFYFIPDPEIQENFFDGQKNNNLYLVFSQNNVNISDWDDVDFFFCESDLKDVYGLNLRGYYIILDNNYSIFLSRLSNLKITLKFFDLKEKSSKSFLIDVFKSLLLKCIKF